MSCPPTAIYCSARTVVVVGSQLTVPPMFMTDFIAYETQTHSGNEQIQLVLFLR